MHPLRELKESLLHLLFPHICEGCGSDILPQHQFLCLRCRTSLPATRFFQLADNPVEKLFWGRIPVDHAAAGFYFTKNSTMQSLMHQLKYRNNPELGHYLGSLMGSELEKASRFDPVDLLLPLPLFRAREKQRGYNQAALLCEGISAVWNRPMLKDAVIRPEATETQTKKNRVERWQNLDGRFEVADPKALEGKHVLLVDDVVTTGATLEACGRTLLQVPGVRLSLAALCISVLH